MTRRRFLGGVSFGALGGLGYARYYEAERLEIGEAIVPLSGETRPGLKLLHLSDLHASGVVTIDYIERSLLRALQWRPDVICLTGDFITEKYTRPRELARALRRLSDAAPCFASLGNHDGGQWAGEEGNGYGDIQWISEVLRDGGVTLLQNRSAQLYKDGWRLEFVGLGDLWSGHFDPPSAFAKMADDSTKVVLSHNPDTKDLLTENRWQLMLSGHTHGGQLRVPWVGATPFAPVRDRRFVAGLHSWQDRWLHVTRGVGSVYGLRINCPPEISFLTLT